MPDRKDYQNHQPDENTELQTMGQTEFVWSSGHHWWGEPLPCLMDNGDYAPSEFWTVDRASLLKCWLDDMRPDLMCYTTNERRLKHANAFIGRKAAIKMMKDKTGGKWNFVVYNQMRRLVPPADPKQVKALTAEWAHANRIAGTLCIRKPESVIKRHQTDIKGITQGLTPADYVRCLLLNDCAIDYLLTQGMVSSPPVEISAKMRQWQNENPDRHIPRTAIKTKPTPVKDDDPNFNPFFD